jgi:hypothetical protein
MTPIQLQQGDLGLKHSSEKISSYSEDVNFYKGDIKKFSLIREPCLVLFSKLLKEGPNGQELEFEHLTVSYIENSCNNSEIPEETTHFFLITEPPVSGEQANFLKQRFYATKTNFPLTYPIKDPFSDQ